MMDHGHENPHQPAYQTDLKPLAIALVITATFLVVEVIGGLITNSLALLADAGHMATDVAALGLSLFAVWLARRPRTPKRSFGYYRAEILAALLNAATLVAISFYIFWEAFERLGAPPEVDSGTMLLIAVAGLAANGVTAWVLMRGGGHTHNLNTRGAFLHVVGDLLGSAGAIAAAPMVQVEGVADVHDLHVRTVTSGLIALTGHVELSSDRDWHDILLEQAILLRERFAISHVTLQPEEHAALPEAFRGCSLDSPEGLNACLVPLASLEHHHHGHHH
jgi:cobalt-zinc-cadmium efflux system protein